LRVAAVTAFLPNPYHLQVASFVLINVMLGVSIYVTLSTGQLSLANAGFMSIGAYASALLTTAHGLPIPAGIAAGTLLAGGIGVLVGLPALRLRGVYLAIATLGFGEVVRVLFINWESLTGGAVGVAAIPQMGRVVLGRLREAGLYSPGAGIPPGVLSALLLFLVLLAAAAAVCAFVGLQERSRIGRAFRAIRADEEAAEAVGIETTWYKVLAFAQGAALSGLAGALYAHTTSFISPADFTYHRAVEILVFAVFGGSERLLGPVIGASFLTLMPEALRSLSDYRYVFYGVILVLTMAFRPKGLVTARVSRRRGAEKARAEA
jgi:branched-chain amino acid transport system permease protein